MIAQRNHNLFFLMTVNKADVEFVEQFYKSNITVQVMLLY